jgi:rhodanese-related sulfurtransferase
MPTFRTHRFVLILASGCLAGLAFNTLSGRGIALNRSVFAQAGDEVIDIKEAAGRFHRGVVFVDARPRLSWEFERIPGSVSLPEVDFDALFPALEQRLRREFHLVVYCAGYGCEASHIVARRLREKGLRATVLDEGWPAWQDAGLPTEKGAPVAGGQQ